MHTQNTRVHPRLWRSDFRLLTLAEMAMVMAVYGMIPVVPLWMLSHGSTVVDVAVSMAALVVGMFLSGGFCSYLVLRYRRERVCTLAATLLAVCLLLTHYVPWDVTSPAAGLWVMVVLRLLTGVTFGLAQAVLMCVLVIDVCESSQRTEANHVSAWLGRFGMALGPVVTITVCGLWGFEWAFVACGVMCLVSVLSVRAAELKFKAPDYDCPLWSADRFVLPQGLWLFVNMALTTAVAGMVMAVEHSALFYALLAAGMLVAVLMERFVFVNAELKSEIVTGLLLMAAALLMLRTHNAAAVAYIAPISLGAGIGVCGARYQMFFIKLRRHCQRGTSMSTYLLAWETGLAVGLFAGYVVFPDTLLLLYIAIGLCAVALLMYVVFTHAWYMRNKNR